MSGSCPLTPQCDTSTLIDTSETLRSELVQPPRARASICPLCHSWKPDTDALCDSCVVTGQPVGYPLDSVSIISLTAKPSELRDWLTRYKGRPGDEDPFEQTSAR